MPNKSQLETAYRRINNIGKDEVLTAEQESIVAGAIKAIINYDGKIASETKRSSQKRQGFAEDDYGGLGKYLRDLMPEQIGKTYGAGTIYAAYNILVQQGVIEPLADAEVGANPTEPVETAPPTVNADSGEQPDTPPVVENLNLREQDNMANDNSSINKLTQLAEQAQSAAAGSSLQNGAGAVMPTDSDYARTLEQSTSAVNAKASERLAYSNAAIITSMVRPKPAVEEILVAGKEAMGTIKNPQKVLQSFIEKTKMTKVGDEYEFGNIPNTMDNTRAAKEIYLALEEAAADPSKKFPIFFGTGSTTLKAVGLQDPGAKGKKYVTMSDLIQTMVDNSAGWIPTSVPGCQAILRETTNRNRNSAAKGSGTSKAKKNTTFTGVASVAFSARKDGLEKLSEYHKIVTKEKVTTGGIRSEMAVTYYRNGTTNSGDRKTGKWRIPLVAEQWDLEVASDELRAVLGSGQGVGQVQNAIDANDQKQIAERMESLSKIIAGAVSRGGNKTGILADVETAAAKAQNDAAAEDAGLMGDNA